MDLITGDWVDCVSSGSEYLLTNIDNYAATTTIRVRGWAILPSTVGPHNININFYSSYPSNLDYQGTTTYTVNSEKSFTSLSMEPLFLRAGDIPVLITEISEMTFTIEIP